MFAVNFGHKLHIANVYAKDKLKLSLGLILDDHRPSLNIIDFELNIDSLNSLHIWPDFCFKPYMARFRLKLFLNQKYKYLWNKENRKERKDRLLSYKANPLGVEQHGDDPCTSPFGPRQAKIKLRRTLKDFTCTYPLVYIAMAHPCTAGPLLKPYMVKLHLGQFFALAIAPF